MSATFAYADLASDYASITSGVQGQAIASPGTPGGIAMFGRAAFPVLINTANPIRSVMGAGHYGGTYEATSARAVAWAHTGFFDTSAGARGTLFTNSLLWASRQATPSGTSVAIASGAVNTAFISGLGYTTKTVGTNLTASDLSGVRVLILNGNTTFSAAAITNIKAYSAGGGGILIAGTPWAASTQVRNDANAVLEPFGLVMNTPYSDISSWTVATSPVSALHSALPGVDALLADKNGTTPLSAADKIIAANAGFQVLRERNNIAELNAGLELLEDAYGIIAPTAAAPITTSMAVERLLALFQSLKFDALPNAELFAHPSAADFPGAPLANAVTITKTVTINGNTFADFYMNQGTKPTRIETGLYAAAGATITVTIPADKIAQGLQLHISPNGSEDNTFSSGNNGNWTFFPKLWRRIPLTQTSIQTGHVLGGLLTILVPEGKSLGNFNITISGAMEAPAFVLGQTTDAQWNSGIKNNPAPYGYIQNSKLTIYLPRTQLAAMSNPTEVVSYWKRVMDTADEYYGYTPYRKRGEVVATARYVAAGAAYADYPIEAGWGVSSETLLNTSRVNGDWGTYHELGHNYQNIFNDAFVIALSAEVDVNLFPGMIYTLVHDRTPWDGAHSTYDASSRLPARNTFLALPEAQRTWQKAHDNFPVAYDFYFNLSESFGWEVYKTALTRLMRYLQTPNASTDAALNALSTGDANFRRNRFYLLMCDASGRNLDAYFQRYGLGAVGRGYEITQSVKDQIAAKNYPSWIENTPIDSISAPGTISVSEDSAPGTEVYQFITTDVEDPGQVLDYTITAGNTGGAFTIDRRTGKLRVQKVDAETLGSYNLTVQVQDCGIPRYSATQTVRVEVQNVPEAPQVTGRLYTANSTMANGAIIGNVGLVIEQGRTLSQLEIVSGNDGHFAVNPASGAITVLNPSTLANPGVVVLTIRATDSAGAIGFGTATVICNRTTGILQQRWTGAAMTGNPGVTSVYPSFTSEQNAADNYIRRVSGWLVPATSGIYTFWISSDDGSTLSLGTDETEASKQPIASVEGYTNFQQWTAQANQMSAPVFLQAGRAYYIEAIQSEGGSADHVSVAWQGPGITRQVIPGSVLVPRNVTTSFPPNAPLPTVSIGSPDEGAFLFSPGVFPITALIGDNMLNISKVQFYDGETLLGEDTLAPYSFSWTNPTAGMHYLKAKVSHSAGVLESNVRTVRIAAAGAPVCEITSPLPSEVSIPPTVGLVLEATVADDTPASLTSVWSKVSGPGNVTFENASSASTAALFSQEGTYVLRLTANDGTNSTTDEVTVITGVTSAPMFNADINGTTAGSGTNDGTIYTVAGAGSDIYNTADRFHFYYLPVTGDFDVRARIVSKTSAGSGAHTALMARENLNTGSIHASITQEGSQSTYLMQRATANSSTSINIGSPISNAFPTWIRLVRVGNSFSGYIGEDGVTWVQKGPITPALSQTALVGFAVSSGSSTTINTATFDNVSGLNGGISAPAVVAGADQTINGLEVALNGTVTDEGLPNPPGVTISRWSKVSGPGTVTFNNSSLPATTATFSQAGSYTLRLTADDGSAKTFDDVVIISATPFVLWQNSKFGSGSAGSANAAMMADPNGNGLVNLIEYAFGSEPEAQGLSPLVQGRAGNRMSLTFPRNTAATDVVTIVEASENLTGAWTELARSANGQPFVRVHAAAMVSESGGSVEVRDLYEIGDPLHPKRFMRVKVEMP